MIFFSALIVTHGREELLLKCLESLKSSPLSWELILILNGKKLSEKTEARVRILNPEVKLIENKTQLSPGEARNQGLKEAQGEWIFFLDDDSYLLSGYWETLVPQLSVTKLDVLGGPDVPPPRMNVLSTALALSLSSPFCTGPTYHRHWATGTGLQGADEEMLSSCNLWVRRSSLEGVSFPEDHLRGEETVFLHALKIKEKGFYYHPKLKVAHYRRDKLSSLFRPTFYAGFYRSLFLRNYPLSKKGIFWLPAIFVIFHLMIFLDFFVFIYFARMYLSLIICMSFFVAFRVRKAGLFPLVAFFHYFLVFIYGTGFIYQRVTQKNG